MSPWPIADDLTDELPIIRDNIKKGFLETQSTVNKWVSNLKKKIDGDDNDDFQGQPAQGGYVPQQRYGGRRSSDFVRRSTDRDRYDADPQVLGDDFAGLQMKDNEGWQDHCRFFHKSRLMSHSTKALHPSFSKSGPIQTNTSSSTIYSIRPACFVSRWPARGN